MRLNWQSEGDVFHGDFNEILPKLSLITSLSCETSIIFKEIALSLRGNGRQAIE
jgi:hypothetical protein